MDTKDNNKKSEAVKKSSLVTANNIDNDTAAVPADKKKKHDHYGHRQRLKNRFLNEGLETFEDHNILELLLFYAIPQRDTNEIAHRLMNHFGSLAAVFDASPEELMKVDGIKENSATLIVLMSELFRAYNRDKTKTRSLEGRENIEKYIYDRLRHEKVERVMLVFVDNRLCRIHDTIINDGTINFSMVDKRKVAEIALRHNATGVFIAHNHPGGFASPSSEDVETTIQLERVLSGIGVSLQDHIIVCPDDYLSMANSTRYALLFPDA